MICALFYFLFFSAIGIFVPYWTLYLKHLQFTPLQIAAIYAVPSATRIFLPPLYGYLADRWKARKPFLITACAGQIVPLALMLRYHSYGQLLGLSLLFAMFSTAVLPFTEATVQEEQEKGRLDYGRTRLWGTLGFIIMAAGFGVLLDNLSQDWVLYGILFLSLILSGAAFRMPEGKMRFEMKHDHLQEALRKPSTWMLLACAFLMFMSHGAFYGFYSIHLSELGFQDSGIGLQWAVAAGSELTVFYFASRILKRFTYRNLLSLCCLAAVLRWFLTGSSMSFWWLTSFQCLHAFTFGVFHITSMRLVHHLFPEGSRGFGQALYASMGGGLGSVLGLLLSGKLWASLAGHTFYMSSALMIVALVISRFLRTEESTLTEVRKTENADQG